ncbi:CgeB family protein [Bacillus rubiinfantis]|uniref:CgeB family protein n=1 Tax=Bacillus rubiinfantis TaxID=1499680 RepID=UPI0005AB6669|nr:glycosyltransferase [Bacillus rubiinfantis]
MRILFISSGYKGIYQWFETCIVNELKKGHEVRFVQCHSGLAAIKSVTASFKPEAALTLVGFLLPLEIVQWLKKQNIKTAVWFTEDPYYMDRTIPLATHYDYIFSIDTAACDYYQKEKGHQHVVPLPLATAPEVFLPKETGPKFKSDLCMVGFPYPDRVKMIHYLLQNTSCKIAVVGKWMGALYKFRQHPNIRIHEGWFQPAMIAQYYNGAKIVLNNHRPFNLQQNRNSLKIIGKSINNRTFDVAACGAFQLIEWKEDLPNHFIEGEEIVSFLNYQDLQEKISYFLKNEAERKQIAHKARERVLNDHTFEKRINQLITYIEK